MEVSKVTEKDGVMAASLLQTLAVSDKLFDALKLAGLPVSGPGLERRSEAMKWFLQVTKQMAESIQTPPADFKVKQVGSLPAKSRKRK